MGTAKLKQYAFFQNDQAATRFHDDDMVRGEYSIIRYIPDMLREEFSNVGVILVCLEIDYHEVKLISDYKPVPYYKNWDSAFLKESLRNLAGDWLLHGYLDIHEFQRRRVNNIQLSPPYTAATNAPRTTLQQFFREFVERDS